MTETTPTFIKKPDAPWFRHFVRFAGGVVVFGLLIIALVSAVNMAELRDATFWRRHASEVILAAQTFEDNFIDLQRGVRGYVTLSDTNALASYQASLKLEPQQFNELVKLTSDNPGQERRLKDLSAAMMKVFSYDERVIDLYHKHGVAAVLKSDVNGESRLVFGNAHDVLTAFMQQEKFLLSARDASEQADYNNAAHRLVRGSVLAVLLLLGSILAALLLLRANQIASRELARRQQVEIEHEKLIGELQRALAKVKTLSGFIPICAWCKNVRSDKGYWESVEQYVHNRTDATFSHGICPSCAEKATPPRSLKK
jgi:CHASE3 domain sensor protein